jgi:hypothetical protein
MKDLILIGLVSVAIIVLVISNVILIKQQNEYQQMLQTIRQQLEQSQKGLVSVNQPDYRIAMVFSICSLIIGIGIGFIVAYRR